METNTFASLGVLQIPFTSRLLTSACCPDKDLVALISHLGGCDRLSVWNYNQGSKVWEVGVDRADGGLAEVVGLAWSPDGQSIAVAHEPPQITLHSLQDGAKLLTLPLSSSTSSLTCHISGVWWFQDERLTETTSIPDIFKRNGIITGTTHAILKNLPLLDSLQDDSGKLSATDLFAFQGSQTKAISKKSLHPDVIDQWPMLSVNPLTASIGSAAIRGSQDQIPGYNDWDAVGNAYVNSILAVADDEGYLHCYLNGSYPLGAIFLGPELAVTSLFKDKRWPTFLAHLRTTSKEADAKDVFTVLPPTIINIPLLGKRQSWDLAKLSSTARELTWYLMRVIDEMNIIWFGSDSVSGARELGPAWVQAYEAKQREQFGQQEPNAILDLTTLLVTGRATDALLDFLGSGEQMSERGVQKWETTMTEALIKLRDFSEKRIAPACQRLHLVLEELQGLSQLSQYSLFELSVQDISDCLASSSRLIILAAWLSAAARKEVSRFKEFISWLRFETLAANPANDNQPQARHDILEVNNYFTSGLLASSIDNWFMGPVPRFSLGEVGVPEGEDSVLAVLGRARIVANNYSEMRWTTKADFAHIDRNMNGLIDELATRCRRVFDRAAGAACRSAVITSHHKWTKMGTSMRPTGPLMPFIIRERTVKLSEKQEILQYLAISLPSEEPVFICIARLRFSNEALEPPFEVAIVLLERSVSADGEESLVDFDLLEAEFFDDECIIIAYRLRSEDKPTYMATLTYNDLEYQLLQGDGYVTMDTREHLLWKVMEQWKEGRLPSVRNPIKRSHILAGSSKTGKVSVAVNGRTGRRVGCVLDSKGTILESFDIEG